MDDKIPFQSLFDKQVYKFVEEKGNRIIAKCLRCSKDNQISGQKGVISNFKTHFRRVHEAAFKNFLKELKSSAPPLKSADGMKQLSIEQVSKPGGKCSQIKADDLIMNFVIDCGLPISTVEQPSFGALINGISGGNCRTFTRRTFVKHLDEQFKSEMKSLKEQLNQEKYVCTTADIWSNRKRSFLGVTAHLINDKLQRESFAIACERFSGTHSHDQIAKKLSNIFESFGLTSKITRTVTDNASNFACAFREFGITEVEAGNEVISIEAAQDDNVEFESMDFEIEEETNQLLTLPPQERCLSHTLSLVGTKDTEKVKLPIQDKRIFTRAFARAQALWNKNNYPKSAEVIKEVLGRSLVTPCATRWNSSYDSVDCLLNFTLETLIDLSEKLGLQPLNEADFQCLKEYRIVMKPLALAIDKLQGEDTCFYGFVIPVMRKLDMDMKSMNDKLEYLKPLRDAVQAGLEKRTHLQSFILQNDLVNDAKLATISHPKFKLRPILKEKREELRELFCQEASKLSPELEVDQIQKNPADDAYFQCFSEDNDQDLTDDNSKNKASIEVLQFLDDPNTSLESLERYPIVKKVFKKFNTTLPSSAPVERLFSFASIILAGRRGRMSDDNFEKLTLLKANHAKNKKKSSM